MNPGLVTDGLIRGHYFDPTTGHKKYYDYEFDSWDDQIDAEIALGRELESLYTDFIIKVHQAAAKYANGTGRPTSNSTDIPAGSQLITEQFAQYLYETLDADTNDIDMVVHDNWDKPVTLDDFANQLYSAALGNGISEDELDYNYILNDVTNAFDEYAS